MRTRTLVHQALSAAPQGLSATSCSQTAPLSLQLSPRGCRGGAGCVGGWWVCMCGCGCGWVWVGVSGGGVRGGMALAHSLCNAVHFGQRFGGEGPGFGG